MKTTLRPLPLFALALLLTLGACAPSIEAQSQAAAAGEELYYAIEVQGALCGYAHLTTSPLSEGGRDEVLLDHRMVIKASLLGVGLDSETELTYHLDPEGHRYSYFASEVRRGPSRLTAEVAVEGDTARFTSSLLGREKRVSLGEDAVLENTLFHPHLRRDFVDRDLAEKTYRVFETADAAVQEVTYRRVGDETLELLESSWQTVVLDRLNRVTGSKARLWIDRERGLLLQARHTGGRLFYYLTDASVPERIAATAVDDSILRETEVSIADIQAITYMKVKARLEPQGLWITPEGLNVPGQRFTGTVEENLIEGVFEIEHPRYDGEGAPPFPPDFSGEPELARYLRAGLLIEADDPALVARARQLTAGAADSWQAARRIARWVSENIEDALPGGITARGVYDSRAGECGGHSVLVAALCRGVGIPARMVWGAMYAPHRGGAFGQHGWTEVYMGEAGWVPLDATAAETDYLDSGHIRLGVFRSMDTALNPIALEVLDYRLSAAERSGAARYEPYVGGYVNRASGLTVEVRVQDGSLTLDIPGRILLSLHDPDAEGRWFAKLTDRLFATFGAAGPGGALELRLHELARMRRTGTPEEAPPAAPPELAPYLGTYHLAQAQADFTVLYGEGGLALRQPGVDLPIRLEPAEGGGRWVDEHGRYLGFETGETGTVDLLAMESITQFERTGAEEARDPAEEAWQKARATGEHHDFLARMEGDWTSSSKVWGAPGQPPKKLSGTSRKTMIMDGRFLQDEASGDHPTGVPFHGRGITGFDNVTGEFISTWIDSLNTGVYIARGQRDGNNLTMHGEYRDPVSKQTMKTRYVLRVVDDDHHVFEGFLTVPGAAELKTWELEYVRKAPE